MQRTADKILRLFEQHGTRCRIAAELWSFENIKNFVQEEVGMAIVPASPSPGTARRHAGPDSGRELAMPRRTLMIYREQGYLSDSARELIKIVRAFNWERWVAGPAVRRCTVRSGRSLPATVRPLRAHS